MRMKFLAGGGAALSLAFLVGLAFGQAGLAQPAVPTQNVGVVVNRTATMDLGPEIEGMAGRQLRLRVITMAPGGLFAEHSHRDRPTVEFVLSGGAVEFRGSAQQTVREGESILSDRNTTHWWRNDGSVPVVFIAADIFRPQ
ncbi:cupin domain-containing protein [Roseomonas sp. CCTCC AB2023176]|uniref:cupin domain-containing protein n=1 Tax=Roseomonas sp. CCTCC AB2023176 TaxID=3342640 RepID=UPI0035DA59A3